MIIVLPHQNAIFSSHTPRVKPEPQSLTPDYPPLNLEKSGHPPQINYRIHNFEQKYPAPHHWDRFPFVQCHIDAMLFAYQMVY